MGAKFEIAVYTGEYIPLTRGYELLRVLGGEARALETCAYRDVLISLRERTFPTVDDPGIRRAVNRGMLVRSTGQLRGAGAGVSLLSAGGVYETALWADTVLHPSLDRDTVDPENAPLYSRLISALLSLETPILRCALGTEIAVEYDDDIPHMIASSHNVAAWIFPSGTATPVPHGFIREFLGSFDVLVRVRKYSI